MADLFALGRMLLLYVNGFRLLQNKEKYDTIVLLKGEGEMAG